MDVQIQSGTSDCGLFAIAYATALSLGLPCRLFQFEQPRMQSHLQNCLKEGRMPMFPIRHTRRVANRVKLTNEFNVYCTDTPETHWIQCSHCREWLHIALCVVVPEQALDPQIAWCVVSVNSYDIQNHYFTMLFFNLCSYRHKGRGRVCMLDITS